MNSTATRRRRPMQKDIHHGRTPAAWAGSILALVGFILGSLGFVFGPHGVPSINWTMVIVGGVLLVAAPLVGGILNRVGMGQD
ncbi:HGxxPAAW family protein [Mariniluteicoccus flavus]